MKTIVKICEKCGAIYPLGHLKKRCNEPDCNGILITVEIEFEFPPIIYAN